MARRVDERAGETGRAVGTADRPVLRAFERTLAYARERDYTGWDYGDGMSSRLRRAIPVESKWLNIAFQQAVKRAPVNVRPLLLVERRRNYKGAALFAMANRVAAGLPDARRADYASEARELADWLVEHRTRGYAGYCASYPHPIQHLSGRGRPGQPDGVNTSFGVKALLRAAEDDPDHAAVVADADRFLLEDLDYRPAPSGRGAVVDYHTKHPEPAYTINAGALVARTLVDLYDRFGDDDLRERARGLLDHVADLQTDLGGWYYREPRSASHLSMDNHHNGFVIESLQRYRAVTGERRYDDTLDRALSFYRERLFEDDGAPNFDEETAYPRDVRASAQGAVVFTYDGDLAFARRVLEWAVDELGGGDGSFYFRRERLFTRRVTLMRWCQASMAFAMGEYLAARRALG
jgi:hypothetical protein